MIFARPCDGVFDQTNTPKVACGGRNSPVHFRKRLDLLPHAQGECCRDSAVNKTLNSFQLHDANALVQLMTAQTRGPSS